MAEDNLIESNKPIYNLNQSHYPQIFVGLQISYSIILYYLDYQSMGNSNNFQQIRKVKIETRNKQLDKFILQFEYIIKKASPQLINKILDSDLTGLVSLLNDRTVTSQLLVAVFGIRAATIGRQLCIITDHYFDFAYKKAGQCDKLRAQSGKTNWTMKDGQINNHFPPLFGIPISIKDNVQMEGTTSTVGLIVRANNIIKKDSVMINCFKNSGMIPFIKTNLPQVAFNFDSNNFLWGRCLNPWKVSKSVGGSSGGQAASIAARTSPIGLGNDMGGSIRIPCHFCGVSGLMPSASRLPTLGAFTKYSTGFSGKDTITAVSGPIGRSIDSLALFMKVATTKQYYQKEVDPYMKFIPFDTKLYIQSQNPKKLKIGYFVNLDLIQSSLACSRAVMQTVLFLKSQNYELVEISIPHQRELVISMFAELVGQGNFQSFRDMLGSEALNQQYKTVSDISGLNCCLFGIAQCLMNQMQPRLGLLIEASKKLTTYEYLQKVGRVKQIKGEWISYWHENQLDFVICPGFGSQATNHGGSKDAPLLAAYTFVWNLLAMTVATTPVTVVRQDEQKYQSRWDDDMTKYIKKTVADSAGLPVGVQIIGLPFEEQRVLGLAKKIESHFNFYQKHPLPNLRYNQEKVINSAQSNVKIVHN